jgi:organic radical activating enzyme
MTNDLKLYVLEEDYKLIAGADWPSYADYLKSAKGINHRIQNELDRFTAGQLETGPKKAVFDTDWITKSKPLNYNIIDHDLVYKRNSHNLPRVNTDIKNTCRIPWNNVTVDVKGRVFICHCDGYVPYSIGHILDFNTFDEIFNHPIAIKIQQSIEKQEFEFCAVDLCGIKHAPGGFRSQLRLFIQIDISCNISCPSCRERMIFFKDEEKINEWFTWTERMKEWISASNQSVQVELAGGDPFASLLYGRVIESYSQLDNVRWSIKTNGLLLQKNFQIVENIKDRTVFSISIDAATEETYKIVRRGGNWQQLISNLEYVKQMKKSTLGNFVIQLSNYKEIIPFVHFCNEYDLKPSFTVLSDWGTWHNYEEQCVHLKSSAHYDEFKQIFRNPIFNNINLSTIKAWL